jgi:hypothetical protein
MPIFPLHSPIPDNQTVLSGLARPRLARLRLDRFAPGADKRSVDVALGPALVKATEVFIKATVREAVQRTWQQPVPPFSEAIQTAFFSAVERHHDAVLKEPSEDTRRDRLQLFQLALLKLCLDRVFAEIDEVKTELEASRSSRQGRQADGRALELHQQAVILAKRERHIGYVVSRRLMREWMRHEHADFSKTRQLVLGTAWPVPEAMLSNPLLQLGGLGDFDDFSRHYHPLLSDQRSAIQAISTVLGVVAEYLPDDLAKSAAAANSSPLAGESGRHSKALFGVESLARQLLSPAELIGGNASWVDAPENTVALLGGSQNQWPESTQWRVAGIDRLQRQLNRSVERAWRKAGLWPDIAAGYAAITAQAHLAQPGLPRLFFDCLRGELSRRELKRKLSAIQGLDEAAVLRRLDQAQRKLDEHVASGRQQRVAGFAGECLRFRRDLKLFWQVHSALERIRLVFDDRERILAMEKEQLQVFCHADSGHAVKGDVVGHAVVTGELRGISELVAMMRLRNTHPADYFSRHLFDPLDYAMQNYGAEKLVSGGDLVSACLFGHAGSHAEAAPVARACCLAVAIVSTVDAMNRESERIGLPRIEVGLGIAYAERAPVYLFDQQRKLTVSPAVDRARELAACHMLLRRNCRLPGERGLCVARPIDGDDDPQAALMRYNVFGIELDGDAFSQLHVELAMRRIRSHDRRADSKDILHAATLVNGLGAEQLVLVRGRPVRLLMGSRLLDPQKEEPQYYEVVTDQRLRDRVQQRLGGTPPRHPVLSAGTAGPFSRDSDLT